METAETTMKGSIPSLALVVEDDPLQREFLCDLLRNENLDVIQCESAEAAELIVARLGPDLTLLVTDAPWRDAGPDQNWRNLPSENFRGSTSSLFQARMV
jgi:response regulator RpfG family c-di-GMP phosphodiesterase